MRFISVFFITEWFRMAVAKMRVHYRQSNSSKYMHAKNESNTDSGTKYQLKAYLLIYPLCFPGGYLHGSSRFAVKKLSFVACSFPPLWLYSKRCGRRMRTGAICDPDRVSCCSSSSIICTDGCSSITDPFYPLPCIRVICAIRRGIIGV